MYFYVAHVCSFWHFHITVWKILRLLKKWDKTFFPGKYNVLFGLSHDFSDQTNGALYRIIIMRHHNFIYNTVPDIPVYGACIKIIQKSHIINHLLKVFFIIFASHLSDEIFIFKKYIPTGKKIFLLKNQFSYRIFWISYWSIRTSYWNLNSV